MIKYHLLYLPSPSMKDMMVNKADDDDDDDDDDVNNYVFYSKPFSSR